MEFIKLPETYTIGNKLIGLFTYTQIKRTDKTALYEVLFTNQDGKTSIVAYEVFKVKITKEMDVVLDGQAVHYDAKEALPKDKAFGKWAWNLHPDLNYALSRFEQLEKDQSTEEPNE